MYQHVPFAPKQWRQGKNLPTEQGIVVGCTDGKTGTTAMIDTGDVHVLMIGAAGVGKTAYWLYPCIEYACATGMSFLSTDTKGDIVRNYGESPGTAMAIRYRSSICATRRAATGTICSTWSTSIWIYTRPIRILCSTRPKRRSMPRSSPRPSSWREAIRPTMDRTPIFTMRRKGFCAPRSSW